MCFSRKKLVGTAFCGCPTLGVLYSRALEEVHARNLFTLPIINLHTPPLDGGVDPHGWSIVSRRRTKYSAPLSNKRKSHKFI